MSRRGVFIFLGVLLIAGPAGAVDPAAKCEAAKLKEAGKYGLCRLKAESRAVKKGEPAVYTKCDAKFVEKWGGAETKYGGACPTSGDEGNMKAKITNHANLTAALLHDPNYQAPGCAQVLATGRTTAYKADKKDGIPGPVAVHDDGTVQAGAVLAYVDNGDGTITDLKTGLMWEKKDDNDPNGPGGLHDKDNIYRWSGDGTLETIWDWLDDVNAEGRTGFAGYSDWRIPNARELLSVIDYGRSNPSVNPVFHTGCAPLCKVTTCSCTASSGYWSTTTGAGCPASAWRVDFSRGGAFNDGKLNNIHVRAVRGGP